MVQEKFRRFEDRGTGIMPFEPVSGRKSNVAARAARTVVGAMLLVVRLPLLAIAVLLHLLFGVVLSLIPLAILRRPLQLFVNAVTARVALFCLGFWYVSARDCQLPGRRRSTTGSGAITSGSLLISNHVGYAHILYLQFRYSPVFTHVVEGGGVVVGDVLSAIAATQTSYQPDKSKAQALHVVMADAKRALRGPVVVFPEVVTSNGQAILPFQTPVKGLECSDMVDRKDVHVIAVKHVSTHFSPCYVVGEFKQHAIEMMMQVYNHMEVLRLPSTDVPVFTRSQDDTDAEEWCERLRKTMAAMVGVKCVSVGVETKREFVQAWATERHGTHTTQETKQR